MQSTLKPNDCFDAPYLRHSVYAQIVISIATDARQFRIVAPMSDDTHRNRSKNKIEAELSSHAQNSSRPLDLPGYALFWL